MTCHLVPSVPVVRWAVQAPLSFLSATSVFLSQLEAAESFAVVHGYAVGIVPVPEYYKSSIQLKAFSHCLSLKSSHCFCLSIALQLT